jgi:hypothetical protein
MGKSYNHHPKKGDYHQGEFKPKNPEKYKGTLPIVARSSWETKFMRFCDTNAKILHWGSETVVIQYFDPVANKTRRYFTDFIIRVQLADGSVITQVIEIKPYKQTIPPVNKNRKNKLALLKEQQMYATNLAKWQAAEHVCKQKGWKFLVLTEKDLAIN